MPEIKRVPRSEPLDTAAEHMAELLRHADELLLEWSKFGAGVRAQVDREAQLVGSAVVDAVDLAVRRAAAEGTARAIGDQLGAQLAAVSAEVAKLESRARAASRAIAEQRRGDRGLLYGLIGAVLVANALLVVGLLREPAAPLIVEPVPVARPLPEPAPPAAPPEAIEPAPAAKPDAPTLAPEPSPAEAPATKARAPKVELKAVPPLRPIKQGPPSGARPRASASPPRD